jgi:hypothetical protein
MALTQVDQGLLGTNAQYTGFKNRIINGAMVINQRGSSITSNGYALDRWKITAITGSKMTVQQSSDAPTGFSNSLLITSSAATTIGSTDYYDIGQLIEGFNTYDLIFGTANAKTITISFWVKSSLTGTFGASLQNSAQNRSYPFTFTISSASTWTQISATIAGDTSGTWVGATSGIGMQLLFNLGTGSSTLGTAGAWTAGYIFPTGEVNILATNGATLQITGVQLEKGSTATSFDYRPYGTELSLCQRYFEVIAPVQTSFLISVYATAGSQEFEFLVKYLVLKRATATVTRVGTWTDSNCSGVEPLTFSTDLFCLAMFSSGSGRCYTYNTGSGSCFTASAEL